MLRKCFLVPVVACVSLLALSVDVAHAQLLRGRRMERRDERRDIVYSSSTMENQSALNQPTMQSPTVQDTPNARISYYYTPATQGLANSAQIRVIVPNAEAKITIDGKATTSTGTDRLFLTPQLTQGAPNNYRVRVAFQRNGEEVTREEVISTLKHDHVWTSNNHRVTI